MYIFQGTRTKQKNGRTRKMIPIISFEGPYQKCPNKICHFNSSLSADPILQHEGQLATTVSRITTSSGLPKPSSGCSKAATLSDPLPSRKVEQKTSIKQFVFTTFSKCQVVQPYWNTPAKRLWPHPEFKLCMDPLVANDASPMQLRNIEPVASFQPLQRLRWVMSPNGKSHFLKRFILEHWRPYGHFWSKLSSAPWAFTPAVSPILSIFSRCTVRWTLRRRKTILRHSIIINKNTIYISSVWWDFIF